MSQLIYSIGLVTIGGWNIHRFFKRAINHSIPSITSVGSRYVCHFQLVLLITIFYITLLNRLVFG